MEGANLEMQKMQDNKNVPLPPPKDKSTALEWIKENLFSSWWNAILTIAFTIISVYVVFGSMSWILFSAEWAVVASNFKLLMVGQYPLEELWRVWVALTFMSALLGVSWGIWNGNLRPVAVTIGGLMILMVTMPFIEMTTRYWLIGNIVLIGAGYFLGKKVSSLKKPMLVLWFLYVPIVYFLLDGFGLLNPVSTNVWGGFLLTLLISAVSITISFPIGVLLALGRRSQFPVIKWMCILYIELIRGIPLITILFVAQLMVPLFIGNDIEIENIIRAMIGFTMFSAAYLAENVRGGLQSIPRGQFEASQALGLNSSLMMFFVVLPQALKAVIPAMVGQFIGIFKDTVLVSIVGLVDILGMAQKIVANPKFLGTQMETFLFVAVVFFIFCYLMSYVSRQMEAKLDVNNR
ncbi:amino acid ABC transporter permease [Bacillus timonensis]|nr:amino acid ABC transporter permease [Bacillus timonensis]